MTRTGGLGGEAAWRELHASSIENSGACYQLLTVQSPREGQWLSQGLTALLGNTFGGPAISLYLDAWLN